MAIQVFTVVALAVLSGKVTADSYCSLDGQWYDKASTPNAQLVFRFATLADYQQTVIAVTTNGQWATGNVDFDLSSGNVTAHLDDGEIILGRLNTTSCSDIHWSSPPNVVWLKVPHVDTVHVVFMNHLDVGYNGIPKVGFINNILNIYFHEYFPRASRLAEEMHSIEPQSGFIYTTHPWLISLYLDCPPNLVLNGIPLDCPSTSELQDFKTALTKGYITWHGGPMNMQVELMNEDILRLSLQLSVNLDAQFSFQSKVLSQRDVPGLTVAAIPTLLQYGSITAVSVGVNPGSAPPDVPNLFRWEYNNQSVLGLWHPGGYPQNPGDSLVNPGGLSYSDCVISEAEASVLAFSFRTDNTGPPLSIDEIQTSYGILQEQFPDAQVFASTLEGFTSSVTDWSLLPVVTDEIGDTWIQGVASDPLKMAQFRVLSSGLTHCLVDGKCEDSDWIVQNASRFLIKLAEHTWGLPNVQDQVNWTNSAFQKAKNAATYLNAENSWIEQRKFVDFTLEASEGHTLHEYLTNALADINPIPPSLDGYKEIDPTQTFKLLNSSVTLSFDAKGGWINLLAYQLGSGHSYTFARIDHPLAVLSYHTYNESDFQLMTSLYDYQGNSGFDKPNSTANAHPNSSTYYTILIALYQSQSNLADFILQVKHDPFTHSYYGAPELIWIRLVLSTNVQPPSLALNFELVWIGKTATRLAEATMLSFTPMKQSSSSTWMGTVQKISNSRSISFSHVVKNGSQYQHVAQQVILSETTTTGTPLVQIFLSSPDVPLVCPIVSDVKTPTPFPAPLDPIDPSQVLGVAFNLHNNIWNTNYPLWYPFTDDDKNFKARFSLSFVPSA